MARANVLGLTESQLTEFSRRHGIRRLALFGSVLSGRDRPDSDVDLLVEFEADARVGLIRLAGIELELGAMLGRKADLRTSGDLSPYFRQEVLDQAKVLYDRGRSRAAPAHTGTPQTCSGRSMNRRQLLRRLSRGAFHNVPFEDAVSLVEGFGFRLVRSRGSHLVFVHPGVPFLLNLQASGGEAKPYQLRQLLRLTERYNLRLEDDE